MPRLTAHFTVDELCRSQWALRHGVSNEAGPLEQARLEQLCIRILEPLRSHLTRPINVSSGYRCPEVNAAIGGAQDSQHLLGEAADFTVQDFSNIEVCDTIVKLALPFDQLIWEFGEWGWVHVSHGPRNRRQILQAARSGGGVVYSDLALG